MTIGGGIALIVIGAILAFAVEFDIAGFDIRIAGYILLIAGLVGIIVGFVQMSSGRRRTTVIDDAPRTRVVEDVPPAPGRRVVRETDDRY